MFKSTQLIPEFIQALQQEINELKKGKGGSMVKVFNGRLLRESSGLYIYLFHLENFLAAVDDTPAEIVITGTRCSCQIVSMQGLEVQIALEKNLGQAIAEARIITNLWFLLELLRKKYEESLPPGDKFKTSERLFAGTSTAVNQGAVPKYNFSKNPPNDSQKNAITASFSKSLAIIWGPPGTGKTKTIAKAVEAHLDAGRRVLLVSHANNAVDEALEDIAEQLKPTTFYQEGKLVRLGICHKTTLEEEYPLVILDNIAAKLGESLTLEKSGLISERLQIESFLESYKALISAQSAVESLIREKNDLQAAVEDMSTRLKTEKVALDKLESSQLRNREKLARAGQAGAVKRLFFGLNPQRIQREIDQLSITIDARKRVTGELEKRYSEKRASLEIKGKELTRTEQELSMLLQKHGLTPVQLKTEKQAKEDRRGVINARIAEIDRALDEVRQSVLTEARLVATTLTKSFISKQLTDQPFDVLIVDESSMAPLPHIYWAASKATSFVTIVGDFLQLPPICVSKDMMAQKWLGRSIFDVLNITSVQSAVRDERVTLLDTQYRMAPQIADIPSRLFYEGLLKSDPGTKSHLIDDSLSGQSPLVVVDTSTINPWCSHLSTGGRFNIYSALVSAAVARKLLREGCGERIGIVTPYRAQARLAGKIAGDWGILDEVRVNTVHSFQGGEEAAIIFDCVEGPGVSNWSMLDDQRKGSDARLLLNVALTRARCKVFLVAHKDYLQSALKRDSIILQIIEIFRAEGFEVSSEKLIDNYLVSDFEKWANAAIGPEKHFTSPEGSLYTEKNFWPLFLDDLRSAEKSLVIMSPFISLRRAGGLMDFFRLLLGRNINIRVYTRPPAQQNGRMSEHAEQVIGQFESLGARVFQRKGMHQKIAIIDNKIVWEGSLNILSHRDTGEQMRRFEGENVSQEIVRNLELDRDEAVGNISEKLCPDCLKKEIESKMVVRQGRYGTFWGCSRYPHCKHTENISRNKRR
jgi:superfamily I DNA and/or RNA helicase